MNFNLLSYKYTQRLWLKFDWLFLREKASQGKKETKTIQKQKTSTDSSQRDKKCQSFTQGSRSLDSCTQSLNLVHKMCCQSLLGITIYLSFKGYFKESLSFVLYPRRIIGTVQRIYCLVLTTLKLNSFYCYDF